MSDEHRHDRAELRRKLELAFRRHLGLEVLVTRAQPLSGGASAAIWRFDYQLSGGNDGLHNAIFRCSADEQAPRFATAIAKHTEAAVQQLCTRANIPVADILFCLDDADALGEGYVMDCVTGETIPRRILRDPALASVRSQLASQCGRILGRIHRIDFNTLTGQLDDQSPIKQLDRLEALYRSYGRPSAVFEVAFHWLRDHRPKDEPLSLVHGDFRNGNLVIDGNGIAAVLDWELCHLGHPVEDLGWLCVNAWRFGSDLPVGGFGDIETLLDAYQEETGRRVTPEELRYWQVFGTLRWGIICLFQANRHTSGQTRSLELAAIGRRVAETEIDLLNLLE
ncbi:MAG: phosphotransferase family protein [Ketobacteraceae bacterium]|nr:phosphotransferase family protein [Ketobacteraceae bacterium]